MNSHSKRNRQLIILILLVCFSSNKLFSQTSLDLNQAMEIQRENLDEENTNLETYIENINSLIDQPINLNKANAYNLEQTNLFNTIQINALLNHIENYGALMSVYELQAIPQFTIDFIKSILPYITTSNNIDDRNLKLSQLLSQGNYQIFCRFQQSFPNKTGFTNNNYIGNPSKLYLRYKYNYGNILSYGLTAEKDQGEPMFRGKNKQGFDFYSFHFFWRKNEKLSALAIGDYQLNFGQGLVLWTGFGFNKSIQVHLNKKEGSTLRPFTSLNEYLFLRGLAFTYRKNNWEITPFLSYKRIDASIRYADSLQTDIENTRIQINGYHRTEQELENKNKLSELKTGANIQYKLRKWHLGFNLLFTNFSEEILFDKKAYNAFQFQGKHLTNTSLDYHYLHKSFHFFGENALSISQTTIGFATLNGVIFTANQNIDLSLIHRYYHRNYQTHYYHNAFGELSTPNGENGIFFGSQIRITKSITLSNYFDYYRISWLQFRTKNPSYGYDFTAQMKQKISKKVEWYINFKREEKEGNTKIQLGSNNQFALSSSNRAYLQSYFGNLDNAESLKPSAQLSKNDIESAVFVTPILLQRLRLHFAFKPNKNWTFQSRFEYSFYNDKINPTQRGFMVFQDVKFKSIKSPVGFSTRIALFDVPQYNSRIYAYENDVLYQFSIPAVYNAGIRYYLNINYRICTWMEVWLRFATTYYSDIKTKGTGNDEVMDNKNYDIKMQIRWKF